MRSSYTARKVAPTCAKKAHAQQQRPSTAGKKERDQVLRKAANIPSKKKKKIEGEEMTMPWITEN